MRVGCVLELNGIRVRLALDSNAECLSQDFDDIAWEPIVDDSPIVDPENDVFGYYD